MRIRHSCQHYHLKLVKSLKKYPKVPMATKVPIALKMYWCRKQSHIAYEAKTGLHYEQLGLLLPLGLWDTFSIHNAEFVIVRRL